MQAEGNDLLYGRLRGSGRFYRLCGIQQSQERCFQRQHVENAGGHERRALLAFPSMTQEEIAAQVSEQINQIAPGLTKTNWDRLLDTGLDIWVLGGKRRSSCWRWAIS